MAKNSSNNTLAIECMLKTFYGIAVQLFRIRADFEDPDGYIYLYRNGDFELSPEKLRLIHGIINADDTIVNRLTRCYLKLIARNHK